MNTPASENLKITFPAELPITSRLEEIQNAIRDNQVIVVAGETGSGKSTQLPKLCLAMGLADEGKIIGHTQPRRIAARSVASRLAEELNTRIGEEIAYKVRFSDRSSDKTCIKVMTDGVLLSELRGSTSRHHQSFEKHLLRGLAKYSVLIIDEAHERSLNIDLLMGLIRLVLPHRPDLKIIVTSATLDPEKFQTYFSQTENDVPLLEVEGRGYPVTVIYEPEDDENEDASDDVLELAADRVMDVLRGNVEFHFDGRARDILVFLSTEREIHELRRLLQGRINSSGKLEAVDLLPLFARLPLDEQQRIFKTGDKRRVILATNVAESSVTVPGIGCVIDTGRSRVSRQSVRGQMQRLPIEPISQAQAKQRQGRCGRIAPGLCMRLYTESNFNLRHEFPEPEIRRSSLTSLLLQLMSLGIDDVNEFPFVDPPARSGIQGGMRKLYEIGAITETRQLSPIGRRLTALPVDPAIGRILLAGEEFGCLDDILIIASVLESQDPRINSQSSSQKQVGTEEEGVKKESDKQKQKSTALPEESHGLENHPNSEFLTLLNIWHFFHTLRQGGPKGKLSRRQLTKVCQLHKISIQRMYEWMDLHRQLSRTMRHREKEEIEFSERQVLKVVTDDRYENIHKALLAGLITQIGSKSNEPEKRSGKSKPRTKYETVSGNTFYLWPGSPLQKEDPQWVMAAELIETSRPFALTLAKINPKWAEDIAPHLIARYHSAPFWHRSEGAAFVNERVSLMGLVLVAKRRVPLFKHDEVAAREMMIQHGLIEGKTAFNPPFLMNNLTLQDNVKLLENKLRRTGELVDEARQYSFYDEVLPESLTDLKRLKNWLKKKNRKQKDFSTRLFMSLQDVIKQDVSIEDIQRLFPDSLRIAPRRHMNKGEAIELKLDYLDAPGEPNDGVTINIPLSLLHLVHESQLFWLVPGYLKEIVTCFLRALPKQYRKAFIPMPESAEHLCKQITFGKGDLRSVLTACLNENAGLTGDRKIQSEIFKDLNLPLHLMMNIRIIDDRQGISHTNKDQSEKTKRLKTKVLAEGRDLNQILKKLREMNIQIIDQGGELYDPNWCVDELHEWPSHWEALPEQVATNRGAIEIITVPAFIDCVSHLATRLFENPVDAAYYGHGGLRRMVWYELRGQIESELAWMDQWQELSSWFDRGGSERTDKSKYEFSLLEQLGLLITELCLNKSMGHQVHHAPNLQTVLKKRDEYESALAGIRGEHIESACQTVLKETEHLFPAITRLRMKQAEGFPTGWGVSHQDLNRWVQNKLAGNFLLDHCLINQSSVETGFSHLKHLARQLKAAEWRIDKIASGNLNRDQQWCLQFLPHENKYLNFRHRVSQHFTFLPAQLMHHGQLLEEMRVSLFAQNLGTRFKISFEKIEADWQKLNAEIELPS